MRATRTPAQNLKASAPKLTPQPLRGLGQGVSVGEQLTPVSRNEVADQLDRLNSNLDELTGLWANIEDRFRPAVAPTEPQSPSNPMVTDTSSPLGAAIDSINSRVLLLREGMLSFLDRCRL